MSEGETCNCKDVKPLSEWVQEESKNPDLCHPCMLPLTGTWYEEALAEAGRGDLAEDLSRLRSGENATVEVVAAFMDSLKEKVEGPLKERLIELDCATQCADS